MGYTCWLTAGRPVLKLIGSDNGNATGFIEDGSSAGQCLQIFNANL